MFRNAEHYPDPTAGQAARRILQKEKIMNTGKRFEADFKASCPKDAWVYRLKDSAATYYGGNDQLSFSIDNICDFLVYHSGHLMLAELKTIDQKSIPLPKILGSWNKEKGKYRKEKHIRDMAAAAKHGGISAVVVIEYRPIRRTFAVPAADVLDFLAAGERKSIPWQWAAVKGIEVEQRPLKVTWRYDIAGLLDQLEKGGAAQ